MIPSCQPESSDTGPNPNRYRSPYPHRFPPVIPRDFARVRTLRAEPIGLGSVPNRSKLLGLTVNTDGQRTYGVSVPDRQRRVK